MYPCRHGNRHCPFIISYCKEGVGWGEVQLYCSYSHIDARAATGIVLSSSITARVGWGKLRRDDKVVLQAGALLLHDQLLGRWVLTGWHKDGLIKYIRKYYKKALVLHHQLLKGKGRMGCGRIRRMFLYKYRCRNRQALF